VKRYLFVFVALFFSCQIQAQKNIGLPGGTSLSNVRIRNVEELVAPLLPSEYQTRYAFYLCGYADFSLSDLIFLTPELFYSSRGYKMVINALNTTFMVTNNTIVLPVLVKFNHLKKLQIYAGPELSYVVKQNIRDLANGAINFESTSDSFFDIPVSAGISFTLIKKFGLGLRYNYGLIDQKKTYYIPGDFLDPSLAGQQIPDDYAAYNLSSPIGFKYSFLSKE
jgi:hypothetical protein